MSTHLPWLSVLVPFYKVEPYLAQCVGSVLEQRDPGIEILLLDDASPDGSRQIAQALQQRHPNQVRVFEHRRNRGLSAARNSLLEHARGDYIWFLDSDDFLLPGAVASVRAAVVRDRPDLILCDFKVVHEVARLKHRLRGEHHRRTFRGPSGRVLHDRALLITGLLAARQLHSWSKVAHSGIWRQARFPEGRAFEDIAVIPALVANSRSFVHIDRPLLGYRQRAGSILASLDNARLHDLLDAVRDLHRNMIPMTGTGGAERFALDYYCLRLLGLSARKAAAGDRDLATRSSALVAELYPDRARGLLKDCRGRGWWLRAHRLQRTLADLHAGAL